ncbi:MAG: D-cysteine desulfhydrase family protein [Spirochaetales bacterium]|nr:D-cysteine desulfhydrase family protein [Spirochaetales bacterium]
MSTKQARARLKSLVGRFPRVRLAELPTPLQELPRFSAALGGPRIYIKRDDLTGLAFGGNKTRMFEFLLARVLADGADTVIGGAAVQSNYCRQLVAAANRLGLETHLVLRRVRGERDDEIQGNLILDLLAGAKVRIIRGGAEEQRAAMFALGEELRRQGRKPAVLRMAGDQDLSLDVIAYVDCFRELDEQCAALGIEPRRLYVASYDTTQAGLELGRAILENPMQVVGVSPARWADEGPCALIARCANQGAEALGVAQRFDPGQISNTLEFVGQGYGIPTPEGVAALGLLARMEGIFLDPVYTGKAMAALMAHVRSGELDPDQPLVFLHTGGATALFAYQQELGLDLGQLSGQLTVE